MTICVGALADNAKAIVCVADKAISYGEYLTGESDSTKIIELPSGAVAMVSGDEDVYDRFLRALIRNSNLGKSIADTINYCERAYQEARNEVVRIRYLSVNLLSEKEFIAASTGPRINRHIEALAKQIADFKMNCSILLCGFDEAEKPYIVSVEDPGQAGDLSRLGYHAIGSGSEYAVARLVGSEWTREKPTDESLFHALDAKISAENSPYVGGSWDAAVILPGKVHAVPKPLKETLDKAWVDHDRSPYYVREPDDLEAPPSDWKQQVKHYVQSCTPLTPQDSVGQP
jgi:20S proteasome alpha/beta subunit